MRLYQRILTLVLITIWSQVGECLGHGHRPPGKLKVHSRCAGAHSHASPRPPSHRLAPSSGYSIQYYTTGGSTSSGVEDPVRAVPPSPAPSMVTTRRPQEASSSSSPSPGREPVLVVPPSRAPSMASSPLSPTSGPFSTRRPQEASSSPSPSPGESVSDDGGLQVGFYKGRCSNTTVDVEAIIEGVVHARFGVDPTILPGILRMQFHDCFVQGCDASILINGTTAEKTAIPNLSIRGFDLMESIKAAVESECPDVVSCADIIAVATKVLLKLGGGPDYPVQTGRRDGLVSLAKNVDTLPSPFLSVNGTIAAFNSKNFTKEEMVILLGCHTVGIAHCGFIQGRLYPGGADFDPLMDPSLRNKLIPICPQGVVSNNSTFLDQGPNSSNVIDNSYFSEITKQRGILLIDQELARDPETQGFVQQLSLNATLFNVELANAMVKLQALDVLTGNQGQIRKVCSKVK